MPIYWSEKVLLVALESTYGTAPTLLAADAILASDIRLTPMEGQDLSRNLERPFMGAQSTIPVDVHAKLAFKTELLASGTAGTPPVIGKLMRACGCAEVVTANTSVAYNPVSRGHESAALHLWIGDTRYALTGIRGTATIRVNASGIPMVEFELTGLFVMPTEATPVVPDLDAQLDAEVLAATTANTPTFTINSVAMVMRSFALAMGNQVEPRFLVGSDSVMITGRTDTIETTVEAKSLSAFNPFALAKASTPLPVSLVHGTAAGKIITLSVPTAQMQRLSGLEEQQGIKEWPLKLAPLPNAGNDQWTLTFT
ncbi:phage tail tube protein [Pararhodobacter sp.]|uniref:phage tail tube protein n=1 Tax=Pararhodobacter sp. TaxID=2127056 RepID=UPI002AFFE0B5|nr:phage tail tube protein [Pararhodobacter sp.]